MNTEEKARRYDEALNWMREIYPGLHGATKEDAEHFFPELTESEDERIRKELIKFIKWSVDRHFMREDFHQAKRPSEWISYLEKQKEQKWSPSEGEMGVLYKLCYLSNQITDEDDTELTRLYQDLKREYFNGHSFENMFPSEKQKEPEDKGEISDGYHTFNELYYYRMLYNAAFFNLLPKEWVHKSKRHHDGEECFGGGWFIVMANLPTGQISNHYELKDWDLFQIPEKEIADEWDGHTPQEAAERLRKYLQEKQKEHQDKTDAPKEKSVGGDFYSSDKDKNLDEIAQDYVDGVKEYNPEPTWDLMQTAVCYGYHLSEEQFEKNRLANCDAVSKEECDRETDFAMEIIEKEHRQPTFNDAINYGMRLQKQKEQKPLTTEETELNSIAFLEQMGYTCIPPGKEQKPTEKQEYSGLNDFERAIHRGFLSAGVENVPVTIIKETAKEFLAQIKPAEWSEEDKDMLNSCISSIEEAKENRYAYKETDGDTSYDHEIAWLKSLRHQSKQKCN